MLRGLRTIPSLFSRPLACLQPSVPLCTFSLTQAVSPSSSTSRTKGNSQSTSSNNIANNIYTTPSPIDGRNPSNRSRRGGNANSSWPWNEQYTP